MVTNSVVFLHNVSIYKECSLLIIFQMAIALTLTGCRGIKKDSIGMTQKELSNFYNYSTIDWAMIDTLYYRPYNCDWPDAIGAKIGSDFPMENTSKYWHRLQNAKTYLHQQTLPLRIGASDEFIKQLNHTESALDTIFVRIVSQEYYMRIFVDCYEEIMPLEIDKCFETLTK